MRRSKPAIGIAAGASLACVLASAATASAATSASTPPTSAAKSASPVIVILNHQSGSAAAAESPLISQVKAAGGTLYPVSAFAMSKGEWRDHFGSAFGQLDAAKRQYDPDEVLTPGYEVF